MDSNTTINQTYKDLQALIRLFVAGIFILAGLNYVFNNRIESLNTQTLELQNKVVEGNNKSQLSSQLNDLKDEIRIKKEIYYYSQFGAALFVIFSILYTSSPVRRQILQAHEELKNTSNEANKMAIRAKQASKAKSDFLANMSHEIRTPLNAILGFVDLLKEKESDEEKLKYIQTVQNSSTTLLGIINDILDFSKIESGNLNIEKIDFNSADEFNTLADLFRAKASEKSVSLTVNIDDNMPSALYSDPLRIKQVIANLLSNAIKFTPRNGRISLDMSYKNRELFVSVKDSGIGIPKDKQKLVFQAFSQAENSTTRKYGGTGLGLSISTKLIEMLGGKLGIESEIGKGSNFYFSIPVEVGKYKSGVRISMNESFDMSGYRVLLVEDNKANQMYMSLILKKFKLNFDIANDGLEAVHAYKDNKYDLILMDENMPNLNGIEATKRILEIEREQNLSHTPIIALTANALKGDREKFLEAGMDEYLTKPISKEKLAHTFQEFFNKKEIRA
jgi:signal transduction histidine kinase/CheY-like chemotaxis protein